LRLVLHREIPDDPHLGDQWNALVGRMESPEVFYTFEWALAVNRAYRASIKPLLFMGFEGEELAGVAALATIPGDDEVFFLAGATADYCDFVALPEHRLEFVNAVLAALRQQKRSRLVLANLPAESSTRAALASVMPQLGYRLFSRPAYDCAQVFLRTPEEQQLVRQLVLRKRTGRRQIAAMEEIGPVRLDHLKSAGEIVQALPDFARTHIARSLSANRLSNLTSSERSAFLQELAESLSPKGWIIFTRLSVGDTAVAWNYGFKFGRKWFCYLATFEGSWQQHSPGFCLLSKIVEEACDNNENEVEVVDLGLGSEAYKNRLATGSRQTLHVIATSSLRQWTREVIRYRTVSAIQTFPRVENWLRVGRDRGSRLLQRLSAARRAGTRLAMR
jgi:CelD/BcsL family acetyltransferase involved in cellulose biosynthesis